MKSHICRRLILLLDGTWNEDQEDAATNIVYLRERLFWGLQTKMREQEAAKESDLKALPETYQQRATSGIVCEGFEYVVYYDRGVGTGPLLDKYSGGLFGFGLDRNIRRAYKFLSFWFRPGDEVFVFGFSRGAFTARSLCGYIHAVGLLKCEHCNADNEARAWKYYRTPRQDRLSADWNFFRQPPKHPEQPLIHDERGMRIRALCVFDTVGALGIPGGIFRRFNRSRYEFHNTDVNSTVDIQLHALAIDEPRWTFEPGVWTKPKFQVIQEARSPTEQVWFVGAHGDVGGGYVKWVDKERRGLSHLPLAWMLQRLNWHLQRTPPLAEETMPFEPTIAPNRHAPIPFYHLDLLEPVREETKALPTKEKIKAPAAKKEIGPLPAKEKIKPLSMTQQTKQLSSARLHKPWVWARFLLPAGRRVINQFAPSKALWLKGKVPHADPIGEMIHISALERLKAYIQKQDPLTRWSQIKRFFGVGPPYFPDNLITIIPYIAATYVRHRKIRTPWESVVEPVFTWKEIEVVDWNGLRLRPTEEADVRRVFGLLPEPETIGVTEMPTEMRLILAPRTASWSLSPS